MAETIDTTLKVDNEGPPEYEYRNYVYVTLPTGLGTIRCEEHRYMEGSEWGLAVGDYNRGEIIGEKATLECRTSEKNDTEDITGNGGRVIIAKLYPGPGFNAGVQVKLIVKHKIWGTLRVQAMSNVEKNPPAVSASADFSWKQFEKTEMQVVATITADKQRVNVSRLVKGSTQVNGKVEIKSDGKSIPDVSIDGSASQSVDDLTATTTTRVAVDGIKVFQIISEATDDDTLTLTDDTSKAFEVVTTCSTAANVGDTDGFADASMKIDHSWIFDYELIYLKEKKDSGSGVGTEKEKESKGLLHKENGKKTEKLPNKMILHG